MVQKKIRILIVDDHTMVRSGLKAFVEPLSDLEVVGEAKDGLEAIDRVETLEPDVVLLDLVMPRMDGIEATRAIRQKRPDLPILMITSFAEDEKVIAAIKAGANGYILKDSTPQQLYEAIQSVNRRESYLSPQIVGTVLKGIKHTETNQPKTYPLTHRELEILKMIGQGKTNQEIAAQLVLSIWTVRTHITNILNKLNLENRTQAALYAVQEGLEKI